MHKYKSIYQKGYTYGHDIFTKGIMIGKVSWNDKAQGKLLTFVKRINNHTDGEW
jgi:hypothetical protein